MAPPCLWLSCRGVGWTPLPRLLLALLRHAVLCCVLQNLLGATETTGAMILALLLTLAARSDVQEKLRAEQVCRDGHRKKA